MTCQLRYGPQHAAECDPSIELASLDLHVQQCWENLGISSLADWDVLVFLYRHPASLLSAAQVARFLGYSSSVIGAALDILEALSLIRGSRAVQGVRLYQVIFCEGHGSEEPRTQSRLEHLADLIEDRAGRLLLAKQLRSRTLPQREGSSLPANG